jgi:kynurenine formamidase
MLSIDWHKRGCVAGRGVLIDYLSWAESQGIAYDPWSKHCITVDDLEAVARQQNVTFKPGDILLVRTGTVKAYNEATTEDKDKLSQERHAFSGVEGSERSVAWIWDHHFAAVASDATGFEAWPAAPAWSKQRQDLFCHFVHPANPSARVARLAPRLVGCSDR